MQLEDFDYELPAALIAQAPPEQRDGGRLMVLERGSGALEHRCIVDFPQLLAPGSLLVVNDSRVIPARLWARRQSGGRVEILLVEEVAHTEEEEHWVCLVRSSKRLQAAEELLLDEELAARVLTSPSEGRCTIALPCAAAQRCGAIPLPPYVRRPATEMDQTRYQTVYARAAGSVAAPTAGLHFTRDLLVAIRRRGVQIARITLHVGPGTFQPVRSATVEEHRMEAERYFVSERAAALIARAKHEGRPVVAVGTTVVRTLEATGGQAGSGRTALFIRPGQSFSVVDQLLTNFHLPRSTLLMLVAAFAGRERVLAAYTEAVAERYRFYSYGDAMYVR